MATSNSLPYAGDVSVEEAWSVLSQAPEATLVYVRSAAEWTFVGVPDLRPVDKETVFAEWQSFPGMGVRPEFTDGLVRELTARGVPADAPVLFLCRSGARSRAAATALTAAGFERCYNIADGFEGPPDEDGHRGRVGGWKAKGLPWRQT